MKQNISIVLFAYNRPSHLRRVLIALENRGIDELNLFVDGPKNNNDKIIQKEIKQIFDNNKYNSKMKKNIFYSKRNKGLAKSIIKGITHVAKKRKYIIILEDDCVPREGFFKFVKKNISNLKNNKDIAGICGYQIPELHKKFFLSKNLKTIILNYFIPWAWCVSSEHWLKFIKYNTKNEKVNDSVLEKIKKLVKDEKKIWSYDFIKYNYLNQLSYLYPSKSLVKNIGFDGSGINSKITDVFSTPFSNSKKIDTNIIKNSKYIKLQRKSLLNKIKYFY